MKLIRPITITDAMLTSSNVAETDYAAYAGGTTYALAQRVIVVSTNLHQVWESLQAANVGHTPATNPTWWALVGATNRWKMLDASVSSQTTNTSSINYSFTVTSRTDSVALMNISAASVTITQTTVDGLVYNITTSLISTMGIVDWFSYFMEPVVQITDFVATDLLPYASAVINVTLNDSSNTVACGACVLGLSKIIGYTQYGVTVGIQSYSIKQKDAWGNYTILARAFNKICNPSILVDANKTDQLAVLLAGYRDQLIVYVGSDSYVSTMILGYYKDWSIALNGPNVAICTISLEGLT